MKALLVNGSPRAKGCTYTALTELAKTLEAEGIVDLCQYFEHKKLKGYADFFNSSSSFCCGVI